MHFLLQDSGNVFSESLCVYTHCSERGILGISQARFIDNTDLKCASWSFVLKNFNKTVRVLWLSTSIIFINEIWQEHHKVWDGTILMNSSSMTQTQTTKFFAWPLLKTRRNVTLQNKIKKNPWSRRSLRLDKPFRSRRPNHSQPNHVVAPKSHQTHTQMYIYYIYLWSFAFLPVKCPVFPWHTCTGALWSCWSNNSVH